MYDRINRFDLYLFPSPLAGEGQGEGGLEQRRLHSPSPHPSPVKGEGVFLTFCSFITADSFYVYVSVFHILHSGSRLRDTSDQVFGQPLDQFFSRQGTENSKLRPAFRVHTAEKEVKHPAEVFFIIIIREAHF